MTTLARIAKNSMVLLGAKIFDAVVGLVTLGLIARYLGVHQFGEYAFVRAFCSVIMIIANMGLVSIITREVARDREKASTHLGAGITLMALFSLLSLAVLIIAVELIGPGRPLKLAVYLTGLAFVFSIFGNLFSAVFRAFERMEFEALKLVISQTIYLASVFATVTYDLGFLSVFAALLLANLIGMTLGALITLGKFTRPRLSPDLSLVRVVFFQSLPVGLRQILRKMSLRVDLLLLSFMKTKTEVGYFGSIYRLILNLRVLPNVSSTAIYPFFSRLATGPQSSLLEAYERSLKFILIMALPFTVALVVPARQIVVLIFGEAFLPATVVLQILGVALSFAFLNTFLLMALTAADKQQWSLVSMVFCFITNVLLDLLLIPRFSYVGAALATLTADVILCVTCVRFLYIPGLMVSLYQVFPKPLLSALAMGVILYLFREWGLLIALPLGGLVYLGFLFALRTFSHEEFSAIKEMGPLFKGTRRRAKLAKI